MPTPKQYANPADRQRAYRQRQEQTRREQAQAKGLPSAGLATMPSQARWRALHQHAATSLHTLHAEMQDYYDDRSEVWQDSERGESFLARLEALESLLDEIDAGF